MGAQRPLKEAGTYSTVSGPRGVQGGVRDKQRKGSDALLVWGLEVDIELVDHVFTSFITGHFVSSDYWKHKPKSYEKLLIRTPDRW